MNPVSELKTLLGTADQWGVVVAVERELRVSVHGELRGYPYQTGFVVGDRVIVRADGRVEKSLVSGDVYEV